MKKGLTTLKRLLSLIMVFAMFLTLLPPTVSAAGTTKTLYLKISNSNWNSANARYAAYFFNNSTSTNTWVSMADNDADGYYEVNVPEGTWPNVIFVRMNPGTTANNWNNKWNQTADLTVPTGSNNFFTVGSSGDGWNNQTGSWSAYAGPTYTVAGQAGLCGTEWDIANTANDMTKNASGQYEKVYTNVAAGTYKFKVAVNHSWDVSWGNNGGDVSVSVATAGSTVTVTFDPATKAVAAAVTVPVVKYNVTFNGTHVTSSNSAVNVEKGKDYTTTLLVAAGYELPETVTVTMGGNPVTPAYDATTGELKITGVTGDLVITAVAEEAAPTTKTIYLDVGGNSLWLQGGAWFDAWVWGGAQADAWYTPEDVDADGIYTVEIPADATDIRFLRKNPADTAHSTDHWNRTGDLTIGTNNYYTITDWEGGEWSTKTPAAPTYTVVGEAGLCGSDWATNAVANDMTLNANGKYEKVFTDVANGTYGFKVAVNHSWYVSWGNNGQNVSVTVPTSGSTVTVTFEPATRAITATVTAPEADPDHHAVTFNGTNVTSNGAVSVEDGTDYTATLTADSGYALPETVTVTVGGTTVTPSYDKTTGELKITNVTGPVVITAVGVRVVTGTTVYCINSAGWAQLAAHAWNEGSTGTTWPGKAMTKTTETVNGFDVYSVSFDTAYGKIIFNNNNNGSQTANLDLQAGKYYDLKTQAWYASLEDVPAADPQASDVYLVGSFNSWNTIADEFKMETADVAVLSMELDANTDYEFKVMRQGTWTGCEDTVTDSVEGLQFSAATQANCKLRTGLAGTYVFTYHVSTETLDVEYAQLGHTVTFEGTNITSDGAATAVDGADYTATLTPAEGYELPEVVVVTVGGTAVTPSYNFVTGKLTITNVTGDVVITAAGVAKDDSMITVFFRNDWNWPEVFAYYWGSQTHTNPAWQGDKMIKIDTVSTEYGDRDVYFAKIPADIAGLVFNGQNENNADDIQQTPDITTVADGDAFYIYWDGTRNAVNKFTYPENGGGGDEGEDVNYEATFHFANNLNWGAVNLYTWTDAGTHSGAWPGSAVSQDDDGFYTMTVKYTGPANQGLNFIFNNGGTQTVDLTLPADAFDENHKAEKWIVLTTANDEGKYNADILDNGDSIVISPIIKDNDVTFKYKAPDATSVEVRGTMLGDNGWSNGAAMTKNEHGIWSITIEDVEPGIHEYKFFVDGQWYKDPCNTWVENDNSVFLISDPEKDINQVTVRVHYIRADNTYDNWNVYMWNENGSGQYDFTVGTDEALATIVVDGRDTMSVNFKIRKSVGSNKWAAEESQVTVNLSKIVSGTIDVYYENGTTSQKMNDDVVYGNKVSAVELDYEANTISITTTSSVTDPATAFTLVNTENASDPTTMTYNAEKSSGSTYVYDVSTTLELATLYKYKVKFNEDKKFPNKLYDININHVYATDKFADEFTYDGDDLGATWTSGSTKFVLWAPTAEEVNVNIYTSGTAGTNDLEKTVKMEKGQNGTWIVSVNGDLSGKYYTYSVKVGGETVEAIDPYARSAGVNGNRGMILNLASTDPVDGWSEIANKPANYNDVIIYELHVRDFSIDDSSGVKDEWQGKFLGLTQSGTTTAGGSTTGLDYLVDLGITHLHLLPIYDYASVDESDLDTPQFNWGYDPQNYNVPEGSYSTNPYDGTARVVEMKEMVDVLHENGIGVIMDVVYNHVYDAETFSFNQIVPGYFSRPNSNRSGCGNDTASEREMVRKYIVDSVVYWHDEYHIDGFRFDLVGLIDVVTINQIVADVHALRPDVVFYGEGWDMDDTNKEPGTELAKQGNASKTPGFAYFSDNMRNLLAGDNGKSTGFVSGAAGQESGLVSNYMANPWWTNNPNQVVQYASCHDNHTLVDKLIKSTGRTQLDATVIKMNNLAAAIYMTSQGIPFIHAGEEMLREKVDENGNRIENSYNASDYVNHIEWSNLDDETYAANSAYYAGLIEFRKAHPALSLDSAADVTSKVLNQQASGNLVTFWIDAREVTGETDDSIYVIFNANSSAKSVELPEGDWDVYVNGTTAGTEVIETVSGTVSVPGISAMILVQEESTEEPVPPAAKSNVALPGSFNSWNTSNFMEFAENSTTVTTQTLSLPAGTYTFKVKVGETWYGNGGTIEDTTGDNAWVMDASAGNCTLKATGGAYTFTFDTTTNKLTVTYDPDGGEFGDPDDYYLCGWINNADYAMGIEPGDLKFDEDGKLTTTFAADSYVVVKNGDCTEKYMTQGWLGSVTEATMYSVSSWTETGYDKLMVPGGSEVTFTLVHNDDGTVTLSYEINVPSVEDTSGVQDGLTLHCWNWSFAEIEANMATIAAQGYTAIQTSPIQPLKEATDTKAVGSHWWVYYQPVDFVINTAEGNALGTKEELESMIAAAHQYGIKVIVDVVSNHLANETTNNLSPAIPEYLRNEPDFWHDITQNTNNWENRFEVTQYCMGGLPDLNTGNTELQQIVLSFLKECVDAGVDGFRFDAAKSIETPDDDDEIASDFWPTVVGGAEEYALDTYGKDLYIYGELLDGTGGVPLSAYTKYMAITDNSWGNSLRGNIDAGNAAMAAGYNKAVDPSVLVLWAESHDTYATDDVNQSSAGVSEADIIKTWALVAARADAMGLYFARPESNEQLLGVASVTGWANEEVKEINLFHNAFAGQAEVVSNENGVSYVERGTTGVILVQVADSTSSTVSVTAKAMADGEYVDQITGNTFTVADGKITGEIGSTGIAVVYNAAEPTKYDVTISEVTGGTVEADKETAALGEEVTLTVEADEGKEIDEVTVTDESGSEVEITDNGDGTYTFAQPASDVTVTVTFKDKAVEPTKYDVTVSEVTGGTVEADKETAAEGEEVTLTVEADEGKEIDEVAVTDDAGNEIEVTDNGDGTYTFAQPASDVTVTVTFKDEEATDPADEHKITITPSNSGKTTVSDETPKTGDTVIITAAPDEGCELEKVVVKDADGKEITTTKNSDGTYSYVQPDSDVTIEVTYKPNYKITKGDGSSVLKNSGLDLSFTANGAYAKFTGIEVDGKAVDAANYTAKAGSTVVTLKAAYLKTLNTGKHTITVIYTDGEAEGTFYVTLTADGTTPPTGDNSQIVLWIGLMTVSALAVVVLLIEQRKRMFKA